MGVTKRKRNKIPSEWVKDVMYIVKMRKKEFEDTNGADRNL